MTTIIILVLAFGWLVAAVLAWKLHASKPYVDWDSLSTGTYNSAFPPIVIDGATYARTQPPITFAAASTSDLLVVPERHDNDRPIAEVRSNPDWLDDAP